MKKLFSFFIVLTMTVTATAARPYLVGHRGSRWGVENTKEAFVQGCTRGQFDYLECDVKVTKDKKFIISHDDDVTRLSSSTATISGTNLADLQKIKLTQTRGSKTYTGYLCSLDEYLDICKQYGKRPVIELKWATGINNNDQSNIPALIKAIEAKGFRKTCVILTSMKSCLEYIHKNYSDVNLQFLTGEYWNSHFDWCVTNGIDADIQVGSWLTKTTVDKYHAKKLKVNIWTVNAPTDYTKYKDMGCDFITTDYLEPSDFGLTAWEKKEWPEGGTITTPTEPTEPTVKLTVTPDTEVVMTATVGQTAAAPYKDVKVVGTGLTTAITVNSATGSLTVTKLSGWDDLTGGTLRLTVNVNFSKGAGTYDSYVAIQSTSSYRIELPVLITLNPAEGTTPVPAMTVSPASLTFSGEEGATIASQKVTVTGTNLTAAPTVSGGTDNFTVQSSLTTTGGTITVTPKTTLAAGTHKSTLTIAANGVSKTVSLTATITAKSTVDPNPNPGTPDFTYGNVRFYLQGGKLDVPADNAALWELFKPDYNAYYGLSRADQPITNVTTFAPEKIQDFMTNTKSTWKWLGDHVQKVTTDAGRALDTEVLWRFGVSAFFNCSAAAASTWNGNADFTQAGKPAVWQPLYTFAHKPTKSGATFLGWFNNANGTGTPLATLPTSGNVYACWSGGTTAMENVTFDVRILPSANGIELFFEGTAPVVIYSVNGTMISEGTATNYYSCELQSGMYIVRIGNNTYKFVK